jgi:hypothetical protein
VGDDDHDFGAGSAQLRPFGRDRGFERRDAESLHVGGDRRPERIDRHDAHDADVDAGHVHEH